MTRITRFVLAAAAASLLACSQSAPAPSPSTTTTTIRAALEVSVPGDQPTIQAAIDAASDGDVVVLTAASYQEDFALADGVTVRGAGTGVTVVFGQVLMDGVQQAALEDLTVDGSLAPTDAHGVVSTNSLVAMTNVEVRNFGGDGVRVELTKFGTTPLDRLHVHHNGGYGVYASVADGIEVTNSIVGFNGAGGIFSAGLSSPAPLFANDLLLANGHAAAGAGVRFEDGGGLLVNSIVTGNHDGMSCGATCEGASNIVWGNGTDYAGSAASQPGDLRVDPRLAAPSEGNYRLKADSPGIDAGAPGPAPDHDFDGAPRPNGAGPDIGPFEFGGSPSVAPLVITEVLANPLDEAVGEFVELLNVGDAPVDASGLRIDDGDSQDTLVGYAGGSTVIAPGAYAVIVDPGYTPSVFEVPAGTILLTTGDATIGNGLSTSDPVTLRTASGSVPIDTFSYPFDPGNGVSVEKDTVGDGDVASNWVASTCGSSPGAPNCASAPPAPGGTLKVVINEVMANPTDESSGEFVELLNLGLGSVDLAGWQLSDGDSVDAIGPFGGGSTVLGPGQLAVIVDPDYAGQYAIPPEAIVVSVASSATLGNALSTNDPIAIMGADGTTIEAWNAPFDPGDGVSAERIDPNAGPTASNFTASTCGSGSSPGEANCASGSPTTEPNPVAIVITEVMANALDEDTGEFVELYNAGGEAVDLAGFRLTDGDTEEPLQAFSGSTTVLEPGAFAVVLDAEYAGEYTIPPGTVLLTTDDTTIGSGLSTTDPIALRAPAGNTPLSTFSFPFNPGNGVSAERQQLTGPDLPTNWLASECMATPGAADCSGTTPTLPEEPWIVVGLTITEVMANPIDETTGEYVEVYNAGSTAVDLLDYRIGDDDGSDVVQPFAGGGTVLLPGQYGVIVDSDYAGQYSIPASAVVMTVTGGAIGNGLSTSDPVELKTPDGPGSAVVATFSFPFNPGNGKSVEAVVATGGDVAFNWQASTCRLDLGDANNYASPGAKGCVDPSPQPSGARAVGLPCPNGGADCASGLCATNTVTGATECTEDCSSASCPSGSACVTSVDASWPQLCIGDGSGPATLPPVVINEVVYDGPGVDVDVFVELAGPPGTILDGLELVGINGSNGSAYNAIALGGAIGGDGYFVVAHPSASAAIVAAADMLTTKVDYQNSPDNIVLRLEGEVVDALGYGGFSASETFAGEGGAAADQGPGQSLSRIPDQADTGDNAADFALAAPTPGAANGTASAAPTPEPLLITEVVISPTAAEFVEIHNPGPSPVELSHVYLADYHAYHKITVGGGAPSSADFRLKFPDGATIAAGGYVTISLETEAHFESEHGSLPDFDLAAGGAAPAMAGEYTGSASLSNTQEALTLFFWDGASPLVVDLDYVVWGGTVEGTNKTGVTVGSAAYADDTPLASQDALAAPGTTSVTRCDYAEGSEVATGGNGLDGHDETSEDLTVTFQLLAAVSPGGAGSCGSVCTPDCTGMTCGDDGCGGSCGACTGGQVCDAGQCITPAGPLGLTEVTGFQQPASLAAQEDLVLLQDAAAFQTHFGVAPPASIDFSTQWALYYSAGMRNLPGHVARVTEVVDNSTELFVFYELQIPGEGCEVLEYQVPTWTLVTFPQPSSGATALVPIYGEDDFDCVSQGAVEGMTCKMDQLCEPDTICAGTTFDGVGLCFPSWMHKTYEKQGPVAIPDGDADGLWSAISVTGLATVAMDTVVWFEIDHPDPSQLTISLLPPPSYDGSYNYEGVLFDQVPASGPGVSMHTAVFFYPGDELVNGLWTLKVVDHAAGTTGTITAWGLEFTSRWD